MEFKYFAHEETFQVVEISHSYLFKRNTYKFRRCVQRFRQRIRGGAEQGQF